MTQPSLFDRPAPRPKRVTPMASERIRRASNKQRVLDRLREGPATTMELIAVGGARAVGRCWELRREGHVIQIADDGHGLFIYTLVGR